MAAGPLLRKDFVMASQSTRKVGKKGRKTGSGRYCLKVIPQAGDAGEWAGCYADPDEAVRTVLDDFAEDLDWLDGDRSGRWADIPEDYDPGKALLCNTHIVWDRRLLRAVRVVTYRRCKRGETSRLPMAMIFDTLRGTVRTLSAEDVRAGLLTEPVAA